MNGCPHYEEDPGAERAATTGGARSLSEMVAHLSSEFPSTDAGLIAELVEASLGRTSGARVQNYRLVLAEREVREQLRRGRLRPVEAADEAPDQVGARRRSDEC